MKKIYQLPKEEREIYFRKAADIIKIPFNIIEKDYWVVWILERLFTLNSLKNHLTFKGGTSLSKIYRIIDRFSEDIDVSIEKEFFGFDENNNPEKAPSKNKQRAVLENLSKACSAYVQKQMLMDLENHISEKMKKSDGWQLTIDSDDPDGQTLLFKYPSNIPANSYIRPFVKIEMGARSEHWPTSQEKIVSYAKEALDEKIDDDETEIRVLNAERTFWEKATILHQYTHLPNEKKLPLRISRHYYDFFQLLHSDIKDKALNDLSLLERVVIHKSIYFASAWANFGTARKGTLALIPSLIILNELEKDYALMEPMFFREIPAWNKILKTIAKFEQEFNLP
jgi:predicted nucleotidyltransferase component of viral defense system